MVHESCNSDNDSDNSHASVEKQILSDQSVQSKEMQSSVNCASVKPVMEMSSSISKTPAVDEGDISDDKLKLSIYRNIWYNKCRLVHQSVLVNK